MSSEKQRPGVGVAAILMRNDEVLLGRRKSAHGLGTWGFPGGHLEHGETWESCVIRETLEETGLSIKEPTFFMATNDVFDTDKHYVTIFMRCPVLDGEPKIMEPEKLEEWRWFPWSKLPENLFLPIRNLLKTGYNPFTI